MRPVADQSPSPRSGLLAATTAVLLLLSTVPASADHEADHRYTIEGFVLDRNEAARPDVDVVVTAAEGVLGRDVTDRRGHYRVELHLHNQDLGKPLTVTAGEHQVDIEVTFDPADTETERIHQLSFVGADVTQTDLGFRGFPTWAYLVFGVVVLLVVARSIAKVLKRRRKLLRKQAAPQKRKTGKKARKSRGKSGKRR